MDPKTIIQGAIRIKRVAHAYLFYGPSLEDQQETALWFAQVMNCEAVSIASQPCGRCSACQKIERGVHPDVIFSKPHGAIRSIRIEEIRRIQR